MKNTFLNYININYNYQYTVSKHSLIELELFYFFKEITLQYPTSEVSFSRYSNIDFNGL